jgi:transcriptional regulator with XRE-family HTH domain
LSFRSIVAERDSMATLTEQLREAIETAGVTRYEIAKQTGVSQSALSKFVLGQRGLSNKAMDAVGEYLGLAICKKRQPKKNRGSR